MKYLLKFRFLFFIGTVIILFFFYEYQKEIVKRPHSIHLWRQADCASQALNFYQHGMKFFQPELHCLVSDNGTSGKCAEEFPLYFYSVALLYKIFGYQELLNRGLSLFIYILGLYAIYRFSYALLKNFWQSYFVTFVFFASTVIIFYTNNFVINPVALAMTFIGWGAFFRFFQERSRIYFILTIACFSLATLFKISEGISIIALASLYLLELLGIKFKQEGLVFEKRLMTFVIFIISALVITIWYLYAHHYNSIHQQGYYQFKINPIWKMNHEEINITWKAISKGWVKVYFNKPFIWILLGCFVYSVIRFKKADKLLITLSILFFIGSAGFMALWFCNLRHHDYYIISLYVFPLFILLTFFNILKQDIKGKWGRYITPSILIIVLVFNVIQARKTNVQRNNYWDNEPQNKAFASLYDITPYLRKLGIFPDDKIISIPDNTPCYSLYLMNQKGWTSFADNNLTARLINESIKKGAKYLIINDKQYLSNDYLYPFVQKKIGEYKGCVIFTLDSGMISNKPLVPEIIDSLYCGFDTVSQDDFKFITSQEKLTIGGYNFQTNEKSRSGQYSCKINFTQEYGVGITYQLKPNEKYKIKIWRYSNSPGKSGLVVSSSNKQIYKFVSVSGKKEPSGWKLLETDVYVSDMVTDTAMSIFIWNPGRKDSLVYFDDLSISKYNMIGLLGQ